MSDKNFRPVGSGLPAMSENYINLRKKLQAEIGSIDDWSSARLSDYLNILIFSGDYAIARELAEEQCRLRPRDFGRAVEFARFLVHEDHIAGLGWYSGVLKNNPRNPHFHFGLARLHAEIVGNQIAAMSVVRDVVDYAPSTPNILNLYVLSSMNARDLDPQQSLQDLRRMTRKQCGVPDLSGGTVSKRPRYIIGIVCSSLKYHAVSMFFGPLMTYLDRKSFMVVVFSSTTVRDDLTMRFEKGADLWYDVSKMEDEELLSFIRSERVDVLIDLDNHTPRNRLRVFARRAAPIQVSAYGLNSSTGVDAMDYRLTDSMVDPLGFEGQYSEKLLRTRSCHISYFSGAYSRSVAPMVENGHLTMGSFNDWKKIDEPQVAAWAGLLASCPKSLLRVVGFVDGLGCLRLQRWMQQLGIDTSRVSIETRLSMPQFIERVTSVDLALDSWPYGGSATTATTLSAGVPVMTASGSRAVSRASAAMLQEMQMGHYIASSADRWSDCAKKMLDAPQKLAEDRAKIAERFSQTIGNGERLAAEVGELLIRAIERYRKGKPAEHDAL